MDLPGIAAGAFPLDLAPLDRRRLLRFLISQETSCHLIAAVGDTQWPARVVDVSANGICLLLRRRFEPGTRVALELANGLRVFSCALQMRVVHVSQAGDGAWVLGGAFDRRLSHAELMALLS
jgi:PilZ domain